MKNYYYADLNNNPVGPISLEELKSLRGKNVILNDSLVIEEGTQNWIEYSQLPKWSPPPTPSIKISSVQNNSDEKKSKLSLKEKIFLPLFGLVIIGLICGRGTVGSVSVDKYKNEFHGSWECENNTQFGTAHYYVYCTNDEVEVNISTPHPDNDSAVNGKISKYIYQKGWVKAIVTSDTVKVRNFELWFDTTCNPKNPSQAGPYRLSYNDKVHVLTRNDELMKERTKLEKKMTQGLTKALEQVQKNEEEDKKTNLKDVEQEKKLIQLKKLQEIQEQMSKRMDELKKQEDSIKQ